VVLDLDPTLGHEQRGVRPAIVVSDPDVITSQRYPLLCVVPVTSKRGDGALYPQLSPGSSGLARASFALVDQLRSVDKRRVIKVYGQISPAETQAVDSGLTLFLGLPPAR
jgi:mRNA interferase MazF